MSLQWEDRSFSTDTSVRSTVDHVQAVMLIAYQIFIERGEASGKP